MRALQGKEVSLAVKALQETEAAAVDLIAGQLAQGQQKDGKFSTFEYAPLTKELKAQKTGLSAVIDHLTNYDTGESYRMLYMRVKGEDIMFGTFTDKEDSISKRMKGKAFGHTPDNKEEYVRQNAQPVFNKLIRKTLNL